MLCIASTNFWKNSSSSGKDSSADNPTNNYVMTLYTYTHTLLCRDITQSTKSLLELFVVKVLRRPFRHEIRLQTFSEPHLTSITWQSRLLPSTRALGWRSAIFRAVAASRLHLSSAQSTQIACSV